MKFTDIYNETEENARLALLSLWTPGSHPMRRAVEELFDREPLLAEPVFQSTFGWKTVNEDDDSWKQTLNQTVVEKIGIGAKYRPYKHQVKSWEALKEGMSIVVTSGTGSGKTECFMYPVISDLYEQGRTNAIEAIFLYPLNALMEDQKKRLSEYCAATGLHFAVYNGDTPEYHGDGRDEILPNEIDTRDKIRDNDHNGTRPEILLTNPSMLEYILVRQQDQQMLQESKGKLRWIVIDEAHSYSGSAAVELGYQIKRILDAFEEEAKDVRFACTSATIGGEDGTQSLAEFISTITGQPADQIEVIGGERHVKPLNEKMLEEELKNNNLPLLSVDRVLSLRVKINDMPGMTLRQMWEWLNPDTPFDCQSSLRLIDRLCEMSQPEPDTQKGLIPVLSLRGHFFMRSISGLYACANEKCPGANSAQSLYGHLTTYKSSICPECGAPLLEVVQCKNCGKFIIMGCCKDSQTHIITPCEDTVNRDDYFAIDLSQDEEEADEQMSSGYPNIHFIMPYEHENFFNPVNDAHTVTGDIIHSDHESSLISKSNNGKWVEIRNDDYHSYCPSCGKLAQGKRLYLKHFRIPINFINQTISPVLLKECAPEGRSWGKYIAFTDSRQGTAISAKTFNINVERILSRENMLQELAPIDEQEIPDNILSSISSLVADIRQCKGEIPDSILSSIPSLVANIKQCKRENSDLSISLLVSLIPQFKGEIETLNTILSSISSSLEKLQYNRSLSLKKISECIFNRALFEHIAGDNKTDEQAYKAALLRQTIGRKSLFENSAESMGLITLVYPNLKEIKRPNFLCNYNQKYGVNITEKDWQDYLKIVLDYYFRVGNHIQPLIENERKYIRDSSIGTPVSEKDWLKVNKDNEVSKEQPSLVVLLCAGLGITSHEELKVRRNYVSKLMKEVWRVLKEKKILSVVSADDVTGYNNPRYYKNNEYVGWCYLDLSDKEDGNVVCEIKLAKELKVCPVTGRLLDTTFCGYSPFIRGLIDQKLFDRYKCSDEVINMPIRPKENDQVEQWMRDNEGIKTLKEKGFWSDRHKYCYKQLPPFIAAEHSAQQSKQLLREYTKAFSQKNPSINVLHCSTTMEMGVDIGDIDVVLMDTIPPTAANYLQRVGRAGRMGQSKAIAFSLCNDTPVGQHAFANPMWALQTTNHMIPVRPSQTIIQRHVNSYFFRRYICDNESGIQANASVEDFMSSMYDKFVEFLNKMSTDTDSKDKFNKVFGEGALYTVNVTYDQIKKLHDSYFKIIKELNDAKDAKDAKGEKYKKDETRKIAICIQIRKIQSENLLNYLSEHQFIPNANMPTDVVEFDFTDKGEAEKLYKLGNKVDELKNDISEATDDVVKTDLQLKLKEKNKEIKKIYQDTTARRNIQIALNEYAPEQTVVVNEKNYVSAGVSLWGFYNEETQTKAIYFCNLCGHTEYKAVLDENATCPKCNKNNRYRGIINRDKTFTLAYEPIGFRTDQHKDSSREEKTVKQYYDIRPVLLKVDWTKHEEINMCEMVGSGEDDRILYYNAGIGNGFAFCKHCGRAALEYTYSNYSKDSPIKPGHNTLWKGESSNNICDANENDIARNVVFTGEHPTCYTVLRFKKNADSSEYEKDEKLAYSLGVVLKRALAKKEGIDEGELDFGIKKELDACTLFIYDTAKGGCGYSSELAKDPKFCQDVFDMARKDLEESTCNCHDGACTRCLIDRSTYKRAHLLSKAKALDWLTMQMIKTSDIPNHVINASPSAKIVYRPMRDIVEKAVSDIEVREISLCVSDLTDDNCISEWVSIHSEMGKYINKAVTNGKNVSLIVEYHPDLHKSLSEKQPFISLKKYFPDCSVKFVNDMGDLKTAIIIKTNNDNVRRYFTDTYTILSFSDNWGKDCIPHLFTDDLNVPFKEQEEPVYTIEPEVVRQGTTRATSFQIQNYYEKAIASILEPLDIDMLRDVLSAKQVYITFSDKYINSALASLMLVYLIKELRDTFGFTIDGITLQIDSPTRNCSNNHFRNWTPINMNFPSEKEADEYTDGLFLKVLNINVDHSPEDADHHRWLKIETRDGGIVEIRPDYGISGGYVTESEYRNLKRLDGTVRVTRNKENILYYVIIKKGKMRN